MTEGAAFTAQVYQNPYLPADGEVVDAVVTVTATGAALHAGGPPEAASAIVVDCSGSMANPGTKIIEAKKACAAAIDALRDGVQFAVVAGRSYAEPVFPPTPGLVPATAATRQQAKQAVSRLSASGGTAMGQWLTMVNQLLRGHPAQIRHAILLTDGRNQHETPQQLAQVLAGCQGQFICDARGVGTDWVASELRTIASALLGTADGLPDPRELPAEFEAMTRAAMGKSVADVSLRLWTPTGSQIQFVKQVFPHIEDLTARRVDVTARLGDYPTGSWGAESRDYHLSVRVPRRPVGEERMAARVSLVAGTGPDAPVLAHGEIKAIWTDDSALSTRIHQRVAHYAGQAELAGAIQEGLEALGRQDTSTATAKFGQAVRLAHESGHADTAKRLGKLVEVVDAASGTVRIRSKVAAVDVEMAEVGSQRTIRVTPGASE